MPARVATTRRRGKVEFLAEGGASRHSSASFGRTKVADFTRIAAVPSDISSRFCGHRALFRLPPLGFSGAVEVQAVVMSPPDSIDGAEVLWWAWSGDEPFGFCGDEPVHGFAVCQYSSGELYRFSCNRKWQTLNDALHTDIEQAKAEIPSQYDAGRVRRSPGRHRIRSGHAG